MFVYVGIDIGKFFHTACSLDDGGSRVEQLKCNNAHIKYEKLSFSNREISSAVFIGPD
ncbi:MAG: hypothetical protein ACE5HR_00880 [bacterium]